MIPDFEKAATKALEILIDQKISTLPIVPLPIVKNTSGVLAMPFAELANNAGIERANLVPLFGSNQDAVTFFLEWIKSSISLLTINIFLLMQSAEALQESLVTLFLVMTEQNRLMSE